MELEKNKIEFNADDHKQNDDVEMSLALACAVDKNDLVVPVDAACEIRNKCHRLDDLPNRHLLKKVKGMQKINVILALNTELGTVNNKDLTDQVKSFKR